jgi:hypothetical protein
MNTRRRFLLPVRARSAGIDRPHELSSPRGSSNPRNLVAELGRRFAGLLLVVAASLGIAAARPTAPIAVAPGEKSDAALASACSSFHWAPSLTAVRFELVVLEVHEDSRPGEWELGLSPEIEPALSAVVPGRRVELDPTAGPVPEDGKHLRVVGAGDPRG